MKKLIPMLALIFILASCSKVTQKRLEGTWKLKDIKDISGNNQEFWDHWLDSAEARVVFYPEGTIRTFYFINDVLSDFSSGTYFLSEDDATLIIDDTTAIFNPHRYPLDVTDLHRKDMTLEGRYYLHGIIPSLPIDSFVTLQWDFDQ